MKTTAEIIKEARLAAKLTQQDLETLYDIPHRRVSEWERGIHEPPKYVVNLLLKCLETDFNYKPEVLSEADAPKEKIFTDFMGKPLIEPILSIVKEAFESNKVQIIDTESFEGYTIVDPRKGKPFILSEYDGEEVPIGVTFYVKEV